MAFALRGAGGAASCCSTPARAPHHHSRRHVCCRATQQQQPSSQAEPGRLHECARAAGRPITRDLGKALGSRVVESNVAFKGPEDQPDFWEGEKFDALGKVLEQYFVPGLIVLGIVCGGIAAKTYNDGATAFVKPPTGPDTEPSIIIALPEDGGASAPSPIS